MQQATQPVVVVMGSQGSGKSTFVASLMKDVEFSYNVEKLDFQVVKKPLNMPVICAKRNELGTLNYQEYTIDIEKENHQVKSLALCDTRGWVNTYFPNHVSENLKTSYEYEHILYTKNVQGIVLVFADNNFFARGSDFYEY